MTRATAAPATIVGGAPRVDLLPPEIAYAKRARAVRRMIVLILLLVGALITASYGGVSYLGLLAQQSLDAENARTADLLAQQTEYLEVRTTTERVATAEAAIIVGASTEIDFVAFLSEVQSMLPAGAAIVSVNAETASPLDGYAQATTPLLPQRIGTVNFSVRVPGLEAVRDWLLALETVDGFADALPGTTALQADGSYLVAVTMHVDTDALANRFTTDLDPDAVEAGSTDTETSDTETTGTETTGETP
jgi:hypothetical protein